MEKMFRESHFSIPVSAIYPTILPSCTRRIASTLFNILYEKFQELSGFLEPKVRRLRTISSSTSDLKYLLSGPQVPAVRTVTN